MGRKVGTGQAGRWRRRVGATPTVADVARKAGVSPMTVSRAIRQEAAVLPATRARVHKAIAILGYVPNAAARSLAHGRQCRLALLYSNPSASYLADFLLGCIVQAGESDALLNVESYQTGEAPLPLVRRLLGHQVDAVLLPPPQCDDARLLRALRTAGLPVAQVATGKPASFAYAVTIDDELAAYTLTAYLLAQGHRRIGLITGNANQSASALRRAGYERALRQAGLAVEARLVARGDFSYRSGLNAAEALLAQPARPTAIFASNDDMAAATIAFAHRRGLVVPRDLSVCGFDDTAMASTTWPEITTIRQPVVEMARKATALLAEACRKSGGADAPAVRHLRLEFELVHRDSVAAPAQRPD
jgi:LacI family transcriptional regulator, galactose operon repressor